MRFEVITIFPEWFTALRSSQIWKKGEESGLLNVHLHDLRDYSEDKHHAVDDAPYGGGAGMVMRVEPLVKAVESIEKVPGRKVLYASPQGRKLTQSWAHELAQLPQLVVVSGRYEGVDERFVEGWVDECFSIGDYVLSGGELPAMVLLEAIGRLIPGVVGNWESVTTDSFTSGALKYPQYTRPPVYRGKEVPKVLLSGHHAEIEKWRREQSTLRTRNKGE